jgi:hypothetical protein
VDVFFGEYQGTCPSFFFSLFLFVSTSGTCCSFFRPFRNFILPHLTYTQCR